MVLLAREVVRNAPLAVAVRACEGRVLRVSIIVKGIDHLLAHANDDGGQRGLNARGARSNELLDYFDAGLGDAATCHWELLGC